MSFLANLYNLIYILVTILVYPVDAVNIPTLTATISPEAGKILLLGSGGFIGSYLTKELVNNVSNLLHS